MTSNFVNPSALSLPSPQSEASNSPLPSDTQSAPPRKRQRTEMTQEERKEARAHRNRIAAQNSRDRRKAQFATLELRVAELEDENRRLRAGMTLTDLQHADARRAQEQEREKERERENAELKERIRSLEKGWETVMKVLATQGLPIPTPTVQSTPKSEPSPPPSNTDSSNTTTTFPVLVPSTTVFPLTPSPSISGASTSFDADEPESTCHLARVVSTAAIPPAVPLQRVDSTRLSLLRSPLEPLLFLRRISRRLPSLTTHRLLRQQTRQVWTLGSGKSSRIPLLTRRRLCQKLILLSKNRPFHTPRPPPPRRR